MVYSPSINLSFERQCRSCRFNARSAYLVCAVHPNGPEQRSCPDFEPMTPRLPSSEAEAASLSGQLPAPSNPFEAEWMSFWGPTEEEWRSFWNPEDLPE